MMSANNALSHTPPSTWTSYTANGAEAAGNSNIALGTARWTPTCAIVAAETSQLRWYDLGRFAVTTNTPGAEISTDGGATWTSVFIRNGARLTSALWDPAFISRSYFMRIRPNLGTRWWGDGPLKTVIAQTPSGYAGWVATQHPAANEGPLGDHEKDGILNGVEYAFGLNPTTPNAPSALPLPTRAGNTLTVTFTQPAHIHRRHRRSG